MSYRRAGFYVYGPAVAAVVAAVAFAAEVARGTGGIVAFEQAAGILVGAVALGAAVCVRPAWTLSVGLALSAFSGHWSDMGMPVPLDRVLIPVGILTTVVHEWRARRRALETRPIDWLLMAVALNALCSAVLAGTIGKSQPRFALLDGFSLVAFALFFVAPIAFREARDRAVLLGTLVTLGAYLGVTALIETTGPRGLLLPRYIDDPTVGIHFDRARGPFAEAAANGLALYACAVAACVAFFIWRGRRMKIAAGAVAGLCALGTLLTLTRAVWLGAGVATIVTMLAARETRRFVVPVIVVGGMTVLLAFAVIPGLQTHAEQRQNDKTPLWDRYNSNAAAVRMIDRKPLFGFGWGRFQSESLDYYRQSPDYPLTTIRAVHNVFLANAVELGLVGAGLWLLALLIAVGRGIFGRDPPGLRGWRIGLVAVGVSYAVTAFTTPLTFTLPTLLLWIWAGVLWAPIRARAGVSGADEQQAGKRG